MFDENDDHNRPTSEKQVFLLHYDKKLKQPYSCTVNLKTTVKIHTMTLTNNS